MAAVPVEVTTPRGGVSRQWVAVQPGDSAGAVAARLGLPADCALLSAPAAGARGCGASAVPVARAASWPPPGSPRVLRAAAPPPWPWCPEARRARPLLLGAGALLLLALAAGTQFAAARRRAAAQPRRFLLENPAAPLPRTTAAAAPGAPPAERPAEAAPPQPAAWRSAPEWQQAANVSGWLREVTWAAHPPPGPVGGAAGGAQLPQSAGRPPLAGLWRAGPLCFRRGAGWVWLGAAPSVPVELELGRSLSAVPVPAKAPGGRFVWGRPWAYLAPAAPDRVGTLYHVVWAFLAAAHALLRLRGLREFKGDGVLAMYIAAWDPDHRAQPREDASPRHYLWPLWQSLAAAAGALLRSATDPGAAGGADTVCHRDGVVGGDSMKELARGQSTGRGARPLPLGALRSAEIGALLLGSAPLRTPSRQPAPRRLLLCQRRGLRRFANAPEAVGWARELGWAAEAAVLEDHPVLAQLGWISAADAVAAIHGSAMAWMTLSSPPWKVWIELLGYASRASTWVYSPHNMISVNQGQGVYGRLSRVCGVAHVAWLDRDLNDTVGNPLCDKSKGKPASWKYCGLRIPREPWRAILRDAVAGHALSPRHPNGSAAFVHSRPR
eukprot:TRINITY_DN66012_c0_g1_i1.p1 TRINITY_DN66012_c0_g1~~TRINITY_DN66012_c0_g1_i1.p1  ORF type:complete len:610 (+),score=128.21 TRINITY_DN66012_c0_g1_i1:71-1900(+)